jgi:peroxiredoxin
MTTTFANPAPASRPPNWMRTCLRIAGVYNVLWGAWAILFPHHFWSILAMEQPNYPFLWQCIGMIVGVYGVGYWVAANDAYRHWPIVLVGMLGKIFGPIGFIDAWLLRDAVPLRFGLTLLTNDLVWWVPFALMLRGAYAHHESLRRAALLTTSPASSSPADATTTTLADALARATTTQGRSVLDITRAGPTLLVFLRHTGCTFCREALADIARQRATLESRGVSIVLVHQGRPDQGASTFERYGVADLPRASDPDRTLYRAMGLRRGNLTQLFGPRVWLRGVRAGLIDRHLVGRLVGDGFQMPGAFLVRDGRVLASFRHEDAADRPDYCEIATAGAPASR